MPSKKLLQILFLQYGIGWTVIAILGIIVFVLLGCLIDFRFLILALIWIFLLLPLVVAFLYFFYGMDPLTAFNTMPHKILASRDSLSTLLTGEDSEKEYKVDLNNFKEIKYGVDYAIIFFHKEGWLWLPIGAFTTLEEFKEFLSYLPVKQKSQ